MQKCVKPDINYKDFSVIGHAQNENDLNILESIIIKKTVPTLNTQTTSIQLFIT